MKLIQILSNFFKKNLYHGLIFKANKLRFNNLYSAALVTFAILFTIVFLIFLNLANQKNVENRNNLNEITKSNEFSNLKKFFINKMSSPYEEVRYVIKNNDSIEKILKV